MTVDQSSRLDRLEALAETTLLAIHELSNRQQTTQQHLDQSQQRFDHQMQQHLDQTQQRFEQMQQHLNQMQQRFDQAQQQSQQRFEQIQHQLDQVTVNFERLDARLNRVAAIQEANAEQIVANMAGLVELRNLVADVIRRQR